MAKKIVLTGLLAAGLAQAAISGAQPYNRTYDQPYDESGYGVATLEERVARLEKRLSGNTLIEMSGRVDKLQNEVLKLRGTVEELSHELEKARRQQREMYTEIEQRLQKSTPPATPAASATPPAAASGAEGAAPAPQGGGIAPPAAEPAPPPAPVIDPAVRQAAYQKAFNLLKEGKYNDAIREFKNFIAAYPIGDFTDNAYYWLAEAYYVNRDFAAAGDTFRKLLSAFPQSAKVPDANLKLGFIEYENGQYAAARDLLNDLIRRFPDSSAAKMAEKRLERMRQEKR